MIRPNTQAVFKAIGDLTPNEQQVQFGFRLKGETRVLVPEADAECYFRRGLTWKSQPGHEGS